MTTMMMMMLALNEEQALKNAYAFCTARSSAYFVHLQALKFILFKFFKNALYGT